MINTVHLGLSYACNLSCKHCFVNKSEDVLLYEDYISIIDCLYKEGLFIVVYTYGEPLLYPYFFEIARYVKSLGIAQILMTNGTMITDELADKLLEAGIKTVYVSIDHSKREIHDANRGQIGCFDKAMNSIKLLNKKGISVGIASTITNDNADDIYNIYTMAKIQNVHSVSFLRARINYTMVDLKKESAYFEAFKKIVVEDTLNVSFHDIRLIEIISQLEKEGKINSKRGDYLREMMNCKNSFTLCVHPNGKLSKCNFIKPLDINYDKESFERYIKGEKFKDENSICYS